LARKDFFEVVLSNIASESMNDPVTLALVFVGGAGGSTIRWLVGIGWVSATIRPEE
jgi:hypothetical protein